MSKRETVGLLSGNTDEDQVSWRVEVFIRIITVRCQTLGTLSSNCLPESLSTEDFEECTNPVRKTHIMLLKHCLNITHMSGEVRWPVWERKMVRGRCFTAWGYCHRASGWRGVVWAAGGEEGDRKSWEEDSSLRIGCLAG